MYDYNSTQINLPENIRSFIQRWVHQNVPDKYIYTEKENDSYGIEEESHITILYGLEQGVDPNKMEQDIQANAFQPIPFSLEEVGMFESEKYDVLKINVEGVHLRHLHDFIRKNYPNTYSYNSYNPHCTLCYTKKEFHNEVKKLVGERVFNACKLTARSFLFSYQGNQKKEIRIVPPKEREEAE